MNWLYEQDCHTSFFIADADYRWLETFWCTHRSTRSVVTYLCTKLSRFDTRLKFVSNNRKELVAEKKRKMVDNARFLLAWYTATLINQEVIIQLNETSKLKTQPELPNKNNGCSWVTSLIMSLIFTKPIQMFQKVCLWSCCSDEAFENWSSDSLISIWKLCIKTTVNHEAQYLTYNTQKRWKTP